MGGAPDAPITETASADVTSETVAAGPAPRRRRASTDHVAAGTQLGRYVVVGKLGAGGMGVVMKAYDPELDRAVAIKLLRPSRTTPRAAERLLREAQALARLSHPNVVPVFDVGQTPAGVFIAMELVSGTPLGDWLRASRARREVLAVFRAAGEGLAAAHRAGLIHRDFKPSNVLVGDDGRVRVLDFGVACASDATPSGATVPDDEARDDEPPPDATGPARVRLDSPLTRAGTIVGTPGYMAPEQLGGRTIDARADQYAFCVALYRALCGDWPYPPPTGPTARAATSAPSPERAPPPAPGLPRWLRRAVRRGLAQDPAARFPSMDALLAALARGDVVRRRAAIAVAATTAAAAALALAFTRGDGAAAPAVCATGRAEVGAVWSEAARDRVARAFAATGRAGADETWRRASDRLDRYAAGLAGARDAACAATHVDRTQSEALLDRRMVCLDRRLTELGATLDVLAEAGPEQVDRALELVAALPSPAACGDREALLHELDLAGPPALRAPLRDLAAELDRATVLDRAGRFAEAGQLAAAAVARAEELGHLPTLADALYRLGDTQIETEGYPTAAATVERALYTALAADHDERAAWAASLLLYIAAYAGVEPARAPTWAGLAEAHADRVAERAAFRSQLELGQGLLAQARGDDAATRAHLEAALAAIEGEPTASPLELADQLTHTSMLYWQPGGYETALARSARAIAIAEDLLGPDHVTVGRYLINHVRPLLGLGRADEALAAARRSRAILERTIGPDHPTTALALLREAEALGDAAAALAIARRAVEIFRGAPGQDQRWLLDALLLATDLAATTGAADETAALAREVVAVVEAGPRPIAASAEGAVVEALAMWTTVAECDEAAPLLARAVARLADADADAALAATGLALAARCALRTGQRDDARALATRATAAWDRAAADPDGAPVAPMLPQIWLELAAATARRDRAAAVDHARTARRLAAALPADGGGGLLAEIDAWLVAHAPAAAR